MDKKLKGLTKGVLRSNDCENEGMCKLLTDMLFVPVS